MTNYLEPARHRGPIRLPRQIFRRAACSQPQACAKFRTPATGAVEGGLNSTLGEQPRIRNCSSTAKRGRARFQGFALGVTRQKIVDYAIRGKNLAAESGLPILLFDEIRCSLRNLHLKILLATAVHIPLRMDPMTAIAASGLRARMESLDLLANNIANASTGGYKADREFYSLYVAPEAAGTIRRPPCR